MDTLAFIKNQNETIAQLIVGQISEVLLEAIPTPGHGTTTYPDVEVILNQ